MKYRMIRFLKTLPAIIGMLLNLFSFVLVIAAFVLESKEISPPTGVSRPFAMWVYSILVAFICIFLYLVDLYSSFQQLRSPKKLLIIKIILVFGAIPMVTLIGCQLGICILIWNLYYIAVFLVEIISFIQVFRGENETEL